MPCAVAIWSSRRAGSSRRAAAQSPAPARSPNPTTSRSATSRSRDRCGRSCATKPTSTRDARARTVHPAIRSARGPAAGHGARQPYAVRHPSHRRLSARRRHGEGSRADADRARAALARRCAVPRIRCSRARSRVSPCWWRASRRKSRSRAATSRRPAPIQRELEEVRQDAAAEASDAEAAAEEIARLEDSAAPDAEPRRSRHPSLRRRPRRSRRAMPDGADAVVRIADERAETALPVTQVGSAGGHPRRRRCAGVADLPGRSGGAVSAGGRGIARMAPQSRRRPRAGASCGARCTRSRAARAWRARCAWESLPT